MCTNLCGLWCGLNWQWDTIMEVLTDKIVISSTHTTRSVEIRGSVWIWVYVCLQISKRWHPISWWQQLSLDIDHRCEWSLLNDCHHFSDIILATHAWWHLCQICLIFKVRSWKYFCLKHSSKFFVCAHTYSAWVSISPEAIFVIPHSFIVLVL